jgi:hypothetical protein
MKKIKTAGLALAMLAGLGSAKAALAQNKTPPAGLRNEDSLSFTVSADADFWRYDAWSD